jgi:two-component system cell cycle sensor histidine kinase PleC
VGKLPDGDLALLADKRKLTQVVINLSANAIKFTPAGGSVTISVTRAEDGACHIVVSDTGIGMTADQIPIALSPFGQIDTAYTRRNQGTGLGLPLSKRFVEAMDGTLTISSQPGIGTQVQLCFPAGRVRAAEAGRDASAPATRSALISA